MRIFIETTSPDDIARAIGSGLAEGVAIRETEYPGCSTEEGSALIEEIVTRFAVPVAVPIEGIDPDDIYRQARDVSRISENIIVQLPLVDDALESMHRLSQDGVDVCACFVYTGAQAVLAAKAGATSVRVSLRDIDSHGLAAADVVAEIRSVLEASRCECDVMVSSPASSAQFSECVTAGAQIVCLRPELLTSLLLHPLTDRSVDRFLNGLNQRHKVMGR